MDKELCFVLNGVQVYLDKVLVQFNETPIFFVCKDDKNNHYVSLLMSVENSGYYVIMPSDQEIYKMLSGQIPMRNLFIDAEWYWLVYGKDKPENDSVWFIGGKSINKFVLPDLDAIYEPNTEENKKYVEDFKEEFLK
jgi:hypothetical protein